MPSKLDPGLDRAVRNYKDAVRRLAIKELNPPVLIKGPESLTDWLPGAKKALRSARKGVERDLAVAQAQIAANKGSSGSDAAAWKRLEEAVRRLESELTSPSSVRQRMDEGKRSMMLAQLKAMGVRFDLEPQGSFYAWGDVSGLPAPLNTGMGFFRAALDQKVIVVPGEFFDVNPGKRRAGRHGRFETHVRFSFGPEEAVLNEGLSRLSVMVREAVKAP